MTVSTLRPNGTSSSTGIAVTGSSAHAALSDDSDASYVDFTITDSWVGTLGDLTLPSGAVVKSVALRARSAFVAGTGGDITAYLYSVVGSPYVSNKFRTSWSVATTTTWMTYSSASLSDAIVDASLLNLDAGVAPVGTIRVYEAYVDVTHVAKPTLTVDAPTGTVTDTNLPTVTWTPTLDADGGDQTRYELKVYTDAQYGAGGFDPDSSTPYATTTGLSGTTVGVGVILPDDNYRAYVRVAQTVNGVLHWSDWDSADFTVAVDLPAVPSVTATADNANGRTVIAMEGNFGGDATTDFMEVQRSLDGGTTWGNMRHALGGLYRDDIGPGIYMTGAHQEIYDYESPNGAPAQYRLRALHDYSGVYAASDWAVDSETWTSDSWWLKHPNRPELNTPVVVRSFQTISRAGRQGVFQPLGSTNVVVVSDTRGPLTGSVTLRALTTEAQDALDALLDTLATLMLQSPAGQGGPDYVRFGNHTRSRIVDWADASKVLDELEFTVVPSPLGDVDAWP